MSTPGISAERQQRIKNALEAALRDGFNPERQDLGGKGSAVTEAARRLSEAGHAESRNSVYRFLRTQERRKARGLEHMLPDWSLYAKPGLAAAVPRAGRIFRWLLTAAQDDTDPHPAFWGNLQAYARAIDAEILIAGFTYQQRRHTDRETLTGQYRAELRPFLRFDRFECGPVIFCAEMNTLPTAARPLEGLLTYSQGRPAVYPHTKIALEVAPAMPGALAPVMLTTGAVTVPNYIAKKAGLKAEFHHVLGAVIVETDGARAWCRSISATRDGAFQDLDARVERGQVSFGHRVEGITWGDIHLPTVPAENMAALFDGPGAMLDALRPRYQFFHDLFDFPMTSRHVDGDPLHRAEMAARGLTGIAAHIAEGPRFLRATEREWCRSVVVKSNHDARLDRWVREAIDRRDVENVEYWHRLNLARLEAFRLGLEDFDLVLWALQDADPRRLEGIDFIPIGGSIVICQASGGIECGMHGHLGPNGSRGTASGLSRMASRITIADKHTPQIHDGVYVAGVTGALDQGYNKGPSGWRHAHVVTYPNGKRAIVVQESDASWRA